jgi:hypothetical protein
MSTYSDGERERELVEADVVNHVVAITDPTGDVTWEWFVDHRKATAIWRYLRITGHTVYTTGIDGRQQSRHGETNP